MREHLDVAFELLGLRCTPINHIHFPYDYLPQQWRAQEKVEYDRAGLRKLCEEEGLFAANPTTPGKFAIKSRNHPIHAVEQHFSDWLDLTHYFDPQRNQRPLLPQYDWAGTLYPELATFLIDAAQRWSRLQLLIDCHVTLAFAAGGILDSKSRITTEVLQNGPDQPPWHAQDGASDPAWPVWEYVIEEIDAGTADIAIGISLTNDVTLDLQAHIAKGALKVGRIIHAQPTGGPINHCVANGRHAFELASAMAQRIRQEAIYANPVIHLFIAAPNAFVFFLGQLQNGMGQIQLYEFDFEKSGNRGYTPSLALPVATQPLSTK